MKNKQLICLPACYLIVFLMIAAGPIAAQDIDSTQIGKEYPYKLQLPHGLSVGTIFNRQGIVLENFEMAFTQGDEEPDFGRLEPISELIEFGPSEARINTLNFRFDTWVLPFLSVGGYYGKVWGEQSVSLTAPINLTSVTDIEGQYYGLNLLAVAPVGPVVLSGDYSWSWTTNVRLDDPVLVQVSGLRVIKRLVNKRNPERFFAFWFGGQFQRLANRTSGKIALDEALDLSDENIAEWDMQWEDYKMTPEWDALSPAEKIEKEATYQVFRAAAVGLGETTVHYKFDKRLEYEWNMVIGGNWNINDRYQVRAEYGFLKSKQQLMFMFSYRFGL